MDIFHTLKFYQLKKSFEFFFNIFICWDSLMVYLYLNEVYNWIENQEFAVFSDNYCNLLGLCEEFLSRWINFISIVRISSN